MQPVGVTTVTVVRRGKHYDMRFQVEESPNINKPPLSAETCAQLALLKVVIEPNEEAHSLESQTQNREKNMANYKDVFEGLGHNGDSHYHRSSGKAHTALSTPSPNRPQR